ncbi:rhodanese-like domain-containing protein [Pseudoxanthomonas wuyuanensis]
MWKLIGSLLRSPGPSVPVQEVAQRIAQGAMLLDVREPAELRGGGPPGAISLPLSRLRACGHSAADTLELPADKEYLLICQSGVRSRLAQRILLGDRSRRYANVGGGMQAWVKAGLPVRR